MNRARDTLAELRRLARERPEVCVAFSGGKDSLAVMELCSHAFMRVRAFFMYFVPDLERDRVRVVEPARQRWGVEVQMVPHWNFIRCLTEGIFCDVPHGQERWPVLKVKDCCRMASLDMEQPLVALGWKKSDGFERRQNMRTMFNEPWLIAPLADWTKADVLSYLDSRGIAPPSRSQVSGLDLSMREILRLHDEEPDDYRRVIEYFPYAEAIVKRREFHGVE